ncbi:MAG: class I SAM-dependent methyltransferase [Thermodesulfobacteriota bacterium]|nr:class I SAM-dependent methyltransferase [Thermodesulfobacteriota bacterium]
MNNNLFTEQIFRIGFMFWESQVLFTSIKFGIFDLLEKQPLKDVEIAEKLGASLRGTEILLKALVSIKLLEKENGTYKNTPVSSALLVSDKPGYKGYNLLHLKSMWNDWGNLEKAVLTGKPVGEVRKRLENEDYAELFILAMQNNAVEMADTVSNSLEIGKYNSMLDLGGGPGTYSIAFAGKNEKLEITLLDVPQVIKIAKKMVERNKLTERFSFIEGDLFEVEYKKGYDLIYISHIIHQYSADENLTFLKKAAGSLVEGGDLIIHDFFLDDNGTFPPFSAIFGLNMLLHTDGGKTYTFSEVENWLHEIGFHKIERRTHNKAPSALIIGTK